MRYVPIYCYFNQVRTLFCVICIFMGKMCVEIVYFGGYLCVGEFLRGKFVKKCRVWPEIAWKIDFLPENFGFWEILGAVYIEVVHVLFCQIPRVAVHAPSRIQTWIQSAGKCAGKCVVNGVSRLGYKAPVIAHSNSQYRAPVRAPTNWLEWRRVNANALNKGPNKGRNKAPL